MSTSHHEAVEGPARRARRVAVSRRPRRRLHRRPTGVSHAPNPDVPPGQAARAVSAVSQGWRNVCADEPSWARAYDNSYGSNPAEHLAQTSIGIAPMKRLIPFTKEELHPPGGGWRAAYARRFTASSAQRRAMNSRENSIRSRARSAGSGVVHGSAGDPNGLELSGASYFGGR